MPLRKPSPLLNEAAIEYLADYTRGCLRMIITLLTTAAVQTILEGDECLTLDRLKTTAPSPTRARIREACHEH